VEHFLAYEGKLVALAQPREEYVPEFVPWLNRRNGIEGTLQRPPYSLEMGREWIRGLDKSKGRDEVFAILLRDADASGGWRYIGHTGIHNIKWPDGTGATGSIIVLERGRGRGCGTEAKLLLLYHCFFVLGLRKVHSAVKAWNAQSLGHLIKCGYKIIGRRKKEVFHEAEYVDEILLEVFREEWGPVWQQYKEAEELPRLTPEQRTLIQEETR
jgi:RimJ/RimL family protein N-acetyltransferase